LIDIGLILACLIAYLVRRDDRDPRFSLLGASSMEVVDALFLTSSQHSCAWFDMLIISSMAKT